MKLSRFFFCGLLLTSATAAHAQWRVSAGYAPMVGLRAEFSGFGNFVNPAPVPALSPTGNFIYLDGSVQVDVSGNAGNQTTFWSYTNPAQIVAGNVEMRTLSGGVAGAGSVAENAIAAAAGFEVSGYRHISAVKLPFDTVAEASWGLRVGFQYARADISNSDAQNVAVGTITDSYSLGGNPAPPAPYTGPFNGFGPLLDVGTPTRTTGTANAALTGTRNLDVHLSILQFGTYLDIPIAEKLDLMLEGGALLGIASGSYDFVSTVTVPGAGAQTTTGTASRMRVLPGVYAGLGLRYGLTQHLSLQAGARYQFMKQFDMVANGSNAALNFDSAFTLNFGATWRF